jgi:hypothetical protein
MNRPSANRKLIKFNICLEDIESKTINIDESNNVKIKDDVKIIFRFFEENGLNSVIPLAVKIHKKGIRIDR